MYWTPAKMLLLADVDEYSFANAEKPRPLLLTWINFNPIMDK